MKKIILLLMIIISINCYAQNVRLGITSGISIANYNVKVDGEKNSGSAKVGFLGGLLADISIRNHFSFQPAINFVQKGMQDKQTYNGNTEKAKLNVNHVEIPLNFLYHTAGIGDFFIGGGPSLAFALSGKVKYSDNTSSVSENIKFGNGDNATMKGFDMGLNLMSGYCFSNGLLISVNYNAGFLNLFPAQWDPKLGIHVT